MTTTDMTTIDDLCAYMDRRGITYTRDGNRISADGSIDLSSLKTMAAGVHISASGWIDLRSLETMAEGVHLSAGGSIYMDSLETMPAGVHLSAVGLIYLRSLKTMAEGVHLSTGGSIYMESLETMAKGVSLSAGGEIYLSSLTSETQPYQNTTIRLRTIDGICTRLIRSRRVGDCVVWAAQYFKGHLDTDPKCYVAQQGDTYAHGKTADTALRDLRFKIAQRDLDPADLVEQIRARGVVTFNDYRLLTGACEDGLSEGLRALGLAGAEELPLADALRLCDGAYGGNVFRKLMGVSQ